MKKHIINLVIGLMLIAAPAIAYNSGDLPAGSNIGGHLVTTVINKLSDFASTTSAQFKTVISDGTGTGPVVFGTSPTISNPTVTGTLTGNISGNAATSTALSTAGTTTTVLHGNVSGAPSYGALALGDMASNTANTLLGYGGGGAASDVSVSTGLSLSGGVLTATNTGTVTSASVVSANGLAGTVATATTTPAITLSTTVTGLLKGNGTAISAATSGTDYAPATSGSSILKGNGAGGTATATSGTDYSSGTSGLATGIVKSTTTTGALTIAVAGDFPTLNQNTSGTSASLSGAITANSLLGALTAVAPTAQAVPSCSTSASALQWTSGTGFGCNSAIAASTATSATSATTATNATNTAITDDTTTNATMYPTWVTANTGNLPQKTTSTKLSFNPSTGALSSTSFSGAGTGLTGTATSLTAGTVTTNANLTGPITSVGNAVASLTAHAALIGNGTSAIAGVAPGLSGNVLTSNGTDWVSQAAAGGAGFSAISSGTNTTAAMVIGTGASLGVSGSGTVTATAAPASGLTGATLASSVTASSLTSVGTLTSGALGTGFTKVALAQGGTNAVTAAAALVNLGIQDSANESYLITADTTANRPATPAAGMLRLNTTTFNPEMYANSTWEQLNASPIGNNGILYNPSGNTLPHLRTALANVVSNTSYAKILWIGTSTVSGYQSGGNGVWNQLFTEEYLTAQALTNSYGIPANNDSIFGYPSAQGDQRVTDSRMSVGSGWGSDSVWSIGGPMFSNNSTTNNLSFTLPTTADKVKLWYVTDSAIPLGSFTWQINSGSTTTINEGALSPALANVVITVTPGSNTLKVARVSGTVKIVGYEAYLSTQATVDVINSGVGGVVAANFTGNGGSKPYGLPTVLATFAPDAIFVQMDNNDAISGTSTTTYKSEITSLLTGGAVSTDPFLIAQEPCGSAGGCNSSTLPPYIVAQQQVAAASSLPFVNQVARITSYDNVLTPLGYSNTSTGTSDGLHADTAGYVDESDFLTKEFTTVAGLAPLPNQDVNPALADAAANRTYTGKNVFSGNNTLSGNNTISGNNTFSGANTHSSTETFTGNVLIPTTAGCPAYASTITLTATSPYWEGVNTSTGAVTVNLPVAAQGIPFLIQDCTGNAVSHNITVAPNGSNTINGVNSNMTLSTAYGASAVIGTSATAWFAN